MEIIRRTNTIKMSRPDVWKHMVKWETEIEGSVDREWYILGDMSPHYPVPMVRRSDDVQS